MTHPVWRFGTWRKSALGIVGVLLGGLMIALGVLEFARSYAPAQSGTPAVMPSLLGSPAEARVPATKGAIDDGGAKHEPAPVLTAARAFHHQGSPVDRANAADCLAAAAWYEAGNDAAGQRAVIQTVINRLNHPAFPDTICGVVFQGSQRTTGCQFTFTCDGSLNRRRPSPASWKSALGRAEAALNGAVDETIGRATHYHASYVSPWWSSELQQLSSVGLHIFYSWSNDGRAYRKPIHPGQEASFASLVQQSRGIGHNTDQASPSIANPAAVDPGFGSAPPSSLAAQEAPLRGGQGSAIFMAADTAQSSGRWAMAALKACEGKPDCQVFAYGDADGIAKNRARSAADRDRPLFIFVRDAGSAMEVALWDCDRVKRPNTSQCQPADHKAMKSLMRERLGAG